MAKYRYKVEITGTTLFPTEPLLTFIYVEADSPGIAIQKAREISGNFTVYNQDHRIMGSELITDPCAHNDAYGGMYRSGAAYMVCRTCKVMWLPHGTVNYP